jgi:DNA polymerase-2
MQEFLYYYNLYPTAYIDYSSNTFKILDNVKDSHYDTSWIKIAYLDVKVSSSNLLPSFQDKLTEVSLKIQGEEIILDSSEEFMLGELSGILDSLDIDVIITECGDSFLIPYLYYRGKVNNVKLRLGRLDCKPRLETVSKSYFSYGRVYHKFKGFKLRGRIHIDSSNSMLYQETGIDGVLEISRVCRIPIQDASRYTIGSCMSSLQYYEAYKLGILLPWIPCRENYMSGRHLNIADRGGLILDAKPEIYWNVGEIDFKSLYPMLMYRYNISGETINCECCRDDGVKIPELGYSICRRWRGVVPRAIELPLEKRLQYKKLCREAANPYLRCVYGRRADALKWILVTAFGYLGFRKAKFGSREAHLSVCALARDTLLRTIKIVEESGFKVVHGLIDSLWIVKEGAADEDYIKLVEMIEDRLRLPVSYEGRYKWIIFLKSKINPFKPVNNRYFGALFNDALKYRGIEARRRDTPLIVKKMQLQMLEKLSKADTLRELRERALECLELYREYVKMIFLGGGSIEDLIITKSLSRRTGEYVNRVLHATAARKLESLGYMMEPGQSVRYVVTGGRWISATPPQLYSMGGYNAREYLKMLERAAKTILEPIIGGEKISSITLKMI